MFGPCQVHLTCGSRDEANEVAQALLKKRLVACAKQVPVTSSYWDKGSVQSSEEILLLMESKLENFEQIEEEVGQHHSYKTFVLQAIPLGAISNKAYLWLNKEVRTKST